MAVIQPTGQGKLSPSMSDQNAMRPRTHIPAYLVRGIVEHGRDDTLLEGGERFCDLLWRGDGLRLDTYLKANWTPDY
jgi:hypothetical protein